jgi:endo-1,4-beta-xylanase
MEITRRQLIGSAAAAGLATAAPAARAPTLASIARQRGLRFGTAIGRRNGFEDARYRALIAEQCSVIVPENELKWYGLRPDAKTYDFASADYLFAWADKAHLAIRGHTLLWHSTRWLPVWQRDYDFGANPRVAGETMLREHIETVCRRYGSRIRSYDVVNEAVDPADGALRETVLSKAIGSPQATLDLAFHTARAATPKGTELVYNDYMSWEPKNEAHRRGVLALLEGFRTRGVPVDALGIQGHIGGGGGTGNATGTGGFGTHDERVWRDFLSQVTAMGYRLLITEFDVNDKNIDAGIAERDAQVAAYAKAFFDVTLSYPAVNTVMLWGLADPYSWLQTTSARPDGAPKRPCPYDGDFQPKPLRAAIAAALAAAPVRA